eukprot:gnl/TRDRNA2_/TRDRNA2_198953_c0_seq1.p1 gnl/TRDRNA2_/TRDRNA2_198953_c0~~gnl/TRDRNA2_/TRDRNA2_198953_c0_seq1.p1  ORF type:complete len:326 (-),score=66.64 gnl/TRDRNA2_/TRDRNA2_198953_c0_seq1:87-1019(-)
MLFVLGAAPKLHARPIGEAALLSVPRLASKAKALVEEMRRRDAKATKASASEWRGRGHKHPPAHQKYTMGKDLMQEASKRRLGSQLQPVPASYLFDSPLYNQLDTASFDEEEAEWANRHVRILSAFHGLLRPFDEVDPLAFQEIPMLLAGSKLTTGQRDKYLSQYWRDAVAREIQVSLRSLPEPLVVNCTGPGESTDLDVSLSGFGPLLPEGTRIASIDFKMNGKVGAGSAKGEFVRWALMNRCTSFDELREFRGITYRVQPEDGDENSIVFQEVSGGKGSSAGSEKHKYKRGKIFTKELRADGVSSAIR